VTRAEVLVATPADVESIVPVRRSGHWDFEES
jgi:hypothetical protein